MKSKFWMIVFCLFIVARAEFVSAKLLQIENTVNTIKLTYDFELPTLKNNNGVTLITVDGTENIAEPGSPLLPVYSSQIVLQQGAKVKSFSVVGKAVDLDGEFLIEHAKYSQPLSSFDKNLITPQNTRIYNLNSAYPAQLGYAKDVGKKFGYSILPFNLNPVSYVPASGKISYYKELNIVIELAYEKDVDAGGLNAPSKVEQLNDISAITDDISAVKTYSVASKVFKNVVLDLAQIDYVLIVPEAFEKTDINRLMQYHKDYNGYNVTNITIEWIASQYAGVKPSGGSDIQTKIREFIYDAYSQWGVRFAMLVGEELLIPSRKMHAEAEGKYVDEIPADMYFGCLDGTFDANTNGVYGEVDDGVDGADIDLFAEVYIGRVAVGSSGDFKHFVDKIIAYETEEYDDYLREVHMLGEYLGFGGVSDYAKGMMEQIRLGGTYDGYTTLGFTDSNYSNQYDLDVNLYDYDTDGSWDTASVSTLMNDGSHIFNHLGHANVQYSMRLRNADLDNLSNDNYFFVYSQGCNSGWFDNVNGECFAQKITSMEHGAFGVIMNARYGFGVEESTDGSSQRFARQFWNYGLGNYESETRGQGRLLEPGVANQLSKEKYAPNINDDCMRWTTYGLNLFGDPAAPFRFVEPSYSGGLGTEIDPYLISNQADLLELGSTTDDYSKCFKMTADIDLSGTNFTKAVIAPHRGTSSSLFAGYKFTGVFDGNGKKIINLSIDGGVGNHFVALFGAVYSGGEVKNLGITDCNINGADTVAALCADSDDSIVSNCYSTGTVNGGMFVGGICGVSSSTITDCRSTGTISGNDTIGGLVGWNLEKVNGCYSSAFVDGGSTGKCIGGLVGFNYQYLATISECYSSGKVVGNFAVGGLVGKNYESSIIFRCYSLGQVSEFAGGGLCGFNDGTINTSFWDTEMSGTSYSDGGIAKTTVEMQTKSTFTDAGWDFITIWLMDGYPALKAFYTEQEVYELWGKDVNVPTNELGYADDPAGDGIQNLLKYAIGLNPMEACSAADLMEPVVDDTNGVSIVYNKAKGTEGVELFPMWSDCLLPSNWNPNGFEFSIISQTDSTETWKATHSITGKCGYILLKAQIVE